MPVHHSTKQNGAHTAVPLCTSHHILTPVSFLLLLCFLFFPKRETFGALCSFVHEG